MKEEISEVLRNIQIKKQQQQLLKTKYLDVIRLIFEMNDYNDDDDDEPFHSILA